MEHNSPMTEIRFSQYNVQFVCCEMILSVLEDSPLENAMKNTKGYSAWYLDAGKCPVCERRKGWRGLQELNQKAENIDRRIERGIRNDKNVDALARQSALISKQILEYLKANRDLLEYNW